MGWNTGFSQVTDLNKGCSLPIVLKLDVWREVGSVVRLDTNMLIGTSVWGLEEAKNRTQKPHLTLFLSHIIDYSKNSDFDNGLKF